LPAPRSLSNLAALPAPPGLQKAREVKRQQQRQRREQAHAEALAAKRQSIMASPRPGACPASTSFALVVPPHAAGGALATLAAPMGTSQLAGCACCGPLLAVDALDPLSCPPWLHRCLVCCRAAVLGRQRGHLLEVGEEEGEDSLQLAYSLGPEVSAPPACLHACPARRPAWGCSQSPAHAFACLPGCRLSAWPRQPGSRVALHPAALLSNIAVAVCPPGAYFPQELYDVLAKRVPGKEDRCAVCAEADWGERRRCRCCPAVAGRWSQGAARCMPRW
jgi:hypothetical protein